MIGAAPASAPAKRANHAKVPPDFFGIVPLVDPSAGDAQAMSAAGVDSVRLLRLLGDCPAIPRGLRLEPLRLGDSEHRLRQTQACGSVRVIATLDLF